MVLVGQHAAWYDRVTTLAVRPLYRAAVRHALPTLPTSGRVLDVGTGPGQLLVELGRRRDDISLAGIDPSDDMVGHATRRLDGTALLDRTELHVASAEALPFADASFDAVISTLSSHHWADPSLAINEQARVLRPGGVLWVFDLRGKTPAVVVRAMRERFDAVTQPRVGPLAAAFFVCARGSSAAITSATGR